MVRRIPIVVLALAAVLAPALLSPATAHAHPLVDQARAAYDSARHQQALELLERAEDGSDLTREDLEQLLLIRAMAHRATRQMDLAEVDMFRLASLDPERSFGREVHPQLRRLFGRVAERVPGPIRVEVTAEREGEVVTIEAEVVDDVAAIAQGFRIFGRAAGGTLRQTTQARLDFNAMPSETAEYWAEVLGPGGAVIATHGTEAAPQRIDPVGGAGDGQAGTSGGGSGTGDGSAVGDGGSSSDTGTGGDGDDGALIGGIVGGVAGALVVAGVIVLAVVLSQPTDETQLTRPSVANLVSAPLVLLRFD